MQRASPTLTINGQNDGQNVLEMMQHRQGIPLTHGSDRGRAIVHTASACMADIPPVR